MDSFKHAARAYFNDEKFSDLTVVCAATGKEYKAHRCFVSVHSKWFDRCCSSGFAEGTSRKIELKDDEPIAVDRMMEFFYKFDYSDHVPETHGVSAAFGQSSDEDEDSNDDDDVAAKKIRSNITLHAWVYATAEKYEVAGLKALALKKFSWELKKSLGKQDELESIATLVYGHLPLPENDKELHKMLVDAWIFAGNVRMESVSSSTLAAFLQRVPLFAADVLRRLMLCTETLTNSGSECDSRHVVKGNDVNMGRVRCWKMSCRYHLIQDAWIEIPEDKSKLSDAFWDG